MGRRLYSKAMRRFLYSIASPWVEGMSQSSRTAEEAAPCPPATRLIVLLALGPRRQWQQLWAILRQAAYSWTDTEVEEKWKRLTIMDNGYGRHGALPGKAQSSSYRPGPIHALRILADFPSRIIS